MPARADPATGPRGPLRRFAFFFLTPGKVKGREAKGPVVLESGMLYDSDKNPNFSGAEK
jgi:hypothetical protein